MREKERGNGKEGERKERIGTKVTGKNDSPEMSDQLPVSNTAVNRPVIVITRHILWPWRFQD